MALEFRQTPLMREVNTIIGNAATPVNFTYKAKIHIGNLIYEPMVINSIDLSQDYENNYADEIMLTMTLAGGTYAVDIYPYKDQIEITLIRTPVGEVTGGVDASLGVQTERYSATLVDTGNAVIEGNTKFTPDKEALNLTVINEVSFQLVNKAIQQLRFISVGGMYRDVLAADVIKTILTNESKKVNVGGSRLPIGVDVVDSYNTKVRDHVLIPQGTKLVDMPQYVHAKCGGIYPSGFGYYMQSDHWYIYPSYDLTRMKTARNTITIINVPPNMFPNIERTYRKNGKSIVVLATGDVKFRDNTEVNQLNSGNGVRYSDANRFLSNVSNTVNNKTTLSRGSNNTEVISQTRVNGLNNAPMSNNLINANPYLEFSKMARGNGAMVELVWENSLPSLITPGTMCELMYIDNDVIKKVEGTILKLHSYTHMKETGITNTKYGTKTVLSIFCNIIKK